MRLFLIFVFAFSSFECRYFNNKEFCNASSSYLCSWAELIDLECQKKISRAAGSFRLLYFELKFFSAASLILLLIFTIHTSNRRLSECLWIWFYIRCLMMLKWSSAIVWIVCIVYFRHRLSMGNQSIINSYVPSSTERKRNRLWTLIYVIIVS